MPSRPTAIYLRTGDGSLVQFDSVRRLRRWFRDGRIQGHDLISVDGIRWLGAHGQELKDILGDLETEEVDTTTRTMDSKPTYHSIARQVRFDTRPRLDRHRPTLERRPTAPSLPATSSTHEEAWFAHGESGLLSRQIFLQAKAQRARRNSRLIAFGSFALIGAAVTLVVLWEVDKMGNRSRLGVTDTSPVESVQVHAVTAAASVMPAVAATDGALVGGPATPAPPSPDRVAAPVGEMAVAAAVAALSADRPGSADAAGAALAAPEASGPAGGTVVAGAGEPDEGAALPGSPAPIEPGAVGGGAAGQAGVAVAPGDDGPGVLPAEGGAGLEGATATDSAMSDGAGSDGAAPLGAGADLAADELAALEAAEGDVEDDDLDEAPTQDPQHPGPADGVPEAAPLGTARAAGVQAAMPEGAPASGPGSSSAADGAPGDGTAGSSATPPDEAGDAVRDQPVVAGLGDLSRYDVDALMRLGHYSTRKGRHDRAVSVYSEALIRKPGRVEVHYERAMALLRLGDARRARAAFQRCNELSAAYAPCRYGAARALEALGQTSEAISAYRAYLTQYPTSSQVGAVERRLERLGAP